MMAALLLAELRRIATRRLVRVTVLLTVVGIALGGLAAFAFSGSLSDEAFQQRVAEAKARQVAQDEQIETCLREHDFRGGGPVPEEVAEECFPDNPPAGVDDPRFTRNRLEGILYGVSGALAVVGWALGASLVGAEFASRGMTTLLTWEPRRPRVRGQDRGSGRRDGRVRRRRPRTRLRRDVARLCPARRPAPTTIPPSARSPASSPVVPPSPRSRPPSGSPSRPSVVTPGRRSRRGLCLHHRAREHPR